MKITHCIAPVNFGGGERITLILSLALRELDTESQFLLLCRSPEFEKKLSQHGFSVLTLANQTIGDSPSKFDYLRILIFSSLAFLKKIKDVCQFFSKNQIICAHGFPSNVLAVLLRWIFKQPALYVNHSKKGMMNKIARLIYKNIFSRFDSIVSVGPLAHHSFVGEFPELMDKAIQINNGVQISECDGLNLGVPQKERPLRAIYVARFSPVKNHDFLIEVIRRIPNINLTCVGDGTTLPEFREKIAKYALDNRIKLLGFLSPESIVSQYQRHDVCLFPSKLEGFGMGIVEAFSCGLPVVLFDDVMDKSFEGLALAAIDETAFVTHVTDLVENRIYVASLQQKVLKERKRFDIHVTAAAYQVVFNRILGL
ncbi:glycosyltransferase family 4 protein [Chitinibacter sp. S2-10]|uniref:glycosyltransferase family 4 protein n=1 Tax=Chitinibacter sp. S2-10 TaxID=3373597 RepID=UPI0039772F3F